MDSYNYLELQSDSLYIASMHHKREIEHIRKVRTLDQILKKEYSLLVYLSDQSNIKSISQIAFAIARKHNAKHYFSLCN